MEESVNMGWATPVEFNEKERLVAPNAGRKTSLAFSAVHYSRATSILFKQNHETHPQTRQYTRESSHYVKPSSL